MDPKVSQYSVVIGLLLISITSTALKRSQKCTTPNGEAAQCIPVTWCPVILNAIITRNQTSIKFAQESQCGYDTEPLVCCGTVAFPSRRSSTCNTPNDEIGICIPVSECKGFDEVIKSEDEHFFKNSRCGDDTEQLVCCGSTARQFQKRILEHPQLPSVKVCGFDKDTNKLYSGQITYMDELPWMALLRYKNSNGTDAGFKCGGTLISKRYILTAAHCILISTYNELKLDSVRLGEWKISTEPDCTEGLANLECNDPVIDLKISEMILNTDYDRKSGKHDIALIRLERDVHFTDYVIPICLPNAQHSDPLPNTNLIIAGWGQIESGSKSDYKLKVEVPVKSRDVCTQKMSERGPITDDQICVGGVDGSGSCQSDYGGPLIGQFPEIINGRRQFYQEGVLARNDACGFPAIYTRVSKYADWIIANIKP